MPDLTTLISYLSPNSTTDNVNSGPRSTAPHFLDVSLVAGSIGYGRVSAPEYYTARATYYEDPGDEAKAEAFAVEMIQGLFTKKGWSANKTLNNHVSKVLRRGRAPQVNSGGVIFYLSRPRFSDTEVETIRALFLVMFQARLAKLALWDLRLNGNCIACRGAGSVRYKSQTGFRDCQACHGTGKRALSASIKYGFLGISPSAWKLWDDRYEKIYQTMAQWKQSYDKHLMDQFR